MAQAAVEVMGDGLSKADVGGMWGTSQGASSFQDFLPASSRME